MQQAALYHVMRLCSVQTEHQKPVCLWVVDSVLHRESLCMSFPCEDGCSQRLLFSGCPWRFRPARGTSAPQLGRLPAGALRLPAEPGETSTDRARCTAPSQPLRGRE